MKFGGSWTSKKLDIVEAYLDSYTTALKNKRFDLSYIDAFAGTGKIKTRDLDADADRFVRGSTERAVRIRDKSFDHLIFIDIDPQRCAELNALRAKNPDRDITVLEGDANECLRGLAMPLCTDRGVIFLDPFATQVDWTTVQHIANLNALDMWLLFPVMPIARLLPVSRQPDDVDPKWADCLTRVFGDDRWRRLYSTPPFFKQLGLFDVTRDPGVDGLLTIYRERLAEAFGDRMLSETRTLKNSKGGPLFEVFFCTGNPSHRAIRPSHNIAGHLLRAI